jgi:hypothetical protein
MNVTRGIVTDLLPAYFSGEASEDTRRLVEDYFRENPDFEQMARRAAATPLDVLRAAVPAAAEAEKEKRELQCIGWELRSRRVWLDIAVFYTLWPLVSLAGGNLSAWLGGPHAWGGRIAVWSIAVFFWILYFIRIRRRDVPLALAIVVTLLESVAVLSRVNILTTFTGRASNLELSLIGGLAASCWIWHFRWRRLDRQSGRRASVRGAD